MEKILKNFKRVNINFDFNDLEPDIKESLSYLKQAALHIDNIFRRQQDEALPELYNNVMKGNDETKKTFFKLFNGPWNSLENHKSFLPEVSDRNPRCAFYPENLTKKEFKDFINSLDPDEAKLFEDHYSIIKYQNGKLTAKPYHNYYKEDLSLVSENLKKAASKIKHQGLKKYLEERADALLTGNYRDSDATWVSLKDSPLEILMGPFEVYNDGFLGIKASYEAMIMVVDKEKGEALKEIELNINKLADSFPVPKGSESAVGGLAPMVVVNSLFTAGDAASGVLASAFNLPNDPWVRKHVGWKQVMIYNIMDMKFQTCTKPIANKLLKEGSRDVLFDPYFYFVLLHEVSHGLGPQYRTNGQPVSKCLGALGSGIEEAKADVGSLYLLLNFSGKYGIPSFNQDTILKSYLAGLFRSMRFGIHEAHGSANVIQFNWFEKNGVIKKTADNLFITDSSNLKKVATELLWALTTVQAQGSEEDAEKFLGDNAKISSTIEQSLDFLNDIPIDIFISWPL